MHLKSFLHSYYWQIIACMLAGLLLYQTMTFNQAVIDMVNIFNNETCFNIYLDMYRNSDARNITSSGNITWRNP